MLITNRFMYEKKRAVAGVFTAHVPGGEQVDQEADARHHHRDHRHSSGRRGSRVQLRLEAGRRSIHCPQLLS